MTQRLADPALDATAGPAGSPIESVPLRQLALEAPAGLYVLLRAVTEAAPGYVVPASATVLGDLARLVRAVDHGDPQAVVGLDLIGRCKPGLFGSPQNAQLVGDQARFLGRDPTPTASRDDVRAAGAEAAAALDEPGTARYVVAFSGPDGYPVALTATLRAAEGALYAAAAARLAAGLAAPLDGFTAATVPALGGDPRPLKVAGLLSGRLGFAPHEGPTC